MAAMHQDTSEDHEVVNEKLREIFGVNFEASNNVLRFCNQLSSCFDFYFIKLFPILSDYQLHTDGERSCGRGLRHRGRAWGTPGRSWHSRNYKEARENCKQEECSDGGRWAL